MATVLTADDVVRRIAIKCAYVDERGGVGISVSRLGALNSRLRSRFARVKARSAFTPRKLTNVGYDVDQ